MQNELNPKNGWWDEGGLGFKCFLALGLGNPQRNECLPNLHRL